MKSRCRFIQNEDQVPEGYVPFSSYGNNTPAYNRINEAMKRGLVESVKLVRCEGDIRTGRKWVNKAQAEAAIHRETTAKKPKVEVTTATTTPADPSLARIATALERIANLMPTLIEATQVPRSPIEETLR